MFSIYFLRNQRFKLACTLACLATTLSISAGCSVDSQVGATKTDPASTFDDQTISALDETSVTTPAGQLPPEEREVRRCYAVDFKYWYTSADRQNAELANVPYKSVNGFCMGPVLKSQYRLSGGRRWGTRREVAKDALDILGFGRQKPIPGNHVAFNSDEDNGWGEITFETLIDRTDQQTCSASLNTEDKDPLGVRSFLGAEVLYKRPVNQVWCDDERRELQNQG